MAGSYPFQTNPGSFVTTTYIVDPALIHQLQQETPQLRDVLIRIAQSLNYNSLSMNTRDAGYYVQEEFVCGQIYYPNPINSSTTGNTPLSPEFRQVFRKIIFFGALPNAGTKSVPHGLVITTGFSFTRIYATASDQIAFSYLPIPYASVVLINNIELNVDAVNVNITTGIDRTAYTTTYVVLEYIKS